MHPHRSDTAGPTTPTQNCMFCGEAPSTTQQGYCDSCTIELRGQDAGTRLTVQALLDLVVDELVRPWYSEEGVAQLLHDRADGIRVTGRDYPGAPRPETSSSDGLLTVSDVARRTNLSAAAVRRAIREGELPATKLRGQLRVTEAAVAKWIDESMVEPAPPRPDYAREAQRAWTGPRTPVKPSVDRMSFRERAKQGRKKEGR